MLLYREVKRTDASNIFFIGITPDRRALNSTRCEAAFGIGANNYTILLQIQMNCFWYQCPTDIVRLD